MAASASGWSPNRWWFEHAKQRAPLAFHQKTTDILGFFTRALTPVCRRMLDHLRRSLGSADARPRSRTVSPST